jgi:hypothetical protein
MRVQLRILYLFIFTGLFAFCGLEQEAYSGLVMEQVTYEQGAPDRQNITLYAQDNMLKQVENTGTYSPAVIFNLETGNIVFVNDEKKLYIVLNRDEYLRYIESFMSETKDQTRATRDVKLKKTSEKQDIAGYESKKYEIYDNGKLQTEYWVSNEPGFGDEVDLDKMSKLMNDVKNISQNIGGSASISDNEYKIIQEIYKEGYPMKTVYHSLDDDTVIVEEITSVKKQDIPASEFQPPANYEKITYQDILKQQ